MAALSIRALSKRYANLEVLKGIDLDIESGEFTVLVGPSGCGKSTLLNIVAGLDRPSAGIVEIGGRVVNDIPPKDRDIAMVFQSYALYPSMTVRQNITFGMECRHVPRAQQEAAVANVARLLQIEPLLDRRPSQLSGGQRQRVAIARALLRNSPILILDEATSSLDAESELLVQDALQTLMRNRTSFVIAHRLSTVRRADAIIVLERGRVAEIGRHDELLARPAGVYAKLYSLQIFEARIAQHASAAGRVPSVS